MLSTIKFSIIQVILIYLNYTNGLCPYAHQYYDVLSPDNDIQLHENYMTSMSYDTYATDCNRFVRQPPPISNTIIDHALNTSIDQTQRYISLDNQAAKLATTPNFHAPKFCTDMDRNNFYFEFATKYIQETTCSSKNTTTLYLMSLQLDPFKNYMTENVTSVPCECGQVKFPSCSSKALYSNVDGACNNLERPLDGRAGDCMLRLLPPDYKDGISKMRTSMDGSPLVNARIVSTNLLGNDEDRPLSTRFTQFHAFLGELVISDNGMTLNHDNGMRNSIQYCDHENYTRVNHPQYKAISILPDDVLVQTYPNQKCMPFARSIPCARCRLGPRMVASAVTVAQDLNSVYGASTSMLTSRRTMIGGFLKSQIVNDEELFAIERFNATGRYRCFEGDCEISPFDQRNVQLPTAQALALLFHRNHNRHARILATIKPDWNDEKIFQEARKWNIGEYQHSIYNNYLKTLIGEKLANSFGILPKSTGQFSSYKPDVLLKTILEFQSTAGRHGHAALDEVMTFMDLKNESESKINFRQSELYESIFYDGRVDGLFLAQMSKPAHETTPSVPFKTFLLDLPGRSFGLDLGAADTQRQRDHGIPGYVNYLKYCNNIVEVKHWRDLKKFIDSKRIEKLKKYYKYVEDVDLYVGGRYERKISDALVGPTFACIIGMQFHNVKYGDRFFYEHGEQLNSFRMEQLNEIKTKASFASILCKNTHLDKVLRDPLRLMSKTNNFVPCTVFDDIDYKL